MLRLIFTPLLTLTVLWSAAALATDSVSESQPGAAVAGGAGRDGSGRAPAIDQTNDDFEEIAGAALVLFEREGRGVRIQGLGHTRTELDGREIFTVPHGHALSWSDVSREWMAGVDSYKSPDASMVEGGLGGTLNIRRRKPLDLDQSVQMFSVEASYGELSREVSPQLSYLASLRRSTPVGEVGALVSLLGENSNRRMDVVELEPFVLRHDLEAEPVSVPRGIKWRVSNNDQQQRTIGGVLQWAPQPGVELTWQGLASDYVNGAEEYTVGLRDGETSLVPQSETRFNYDGVRRFQSGYLWSNAWRGDVPGNSVRLNGTTKMAERRNQSREQGISFDYAPSSRWALRGDLQYLSATTEVLDFTVYTSTFVPDFYLDLSADLPRYTLSDSDFLRQPANYFWNAAMDFRERGKANFYAARVDAALDLPESSIASAFMFGVRTSQDATRLLDAGYNWGSLSDNWNPPLQYLPATGSEYAQYRAFDSFFRDRVDFGGFYLLSAEFVGDFDLATEVLTELKSGSEADGWHPNAYSYENESTLERSSQAFYAMLLLEDAAGGARNLRGHLGVRVVGNNVDAMGYGQYKPLKVDEASIAPGELVFADGKFTQIRGGSRHWHVLPSGYLSWDLSNNLVGRMAASRTLLHPDFYQLRAYSEVWAETETQALDDGGSRTVVTRWRGKAGNPGLSPVQVQQYDAALEWQFSETGNVYSALFYKQLTDAIQNSVQTSELSNNDETREVEVEMLTNRGEAKIHGLEIGVSQRLGFLPGALRNVALQSTYTRINSRSSQQYGAKTLPVEGLAEHHLSLSSTYQNAHFRATFNYRWRDDILDTTLDAATTRSQWLNAKGRLDASVSVPLGQGLQLALEARNLTNAVARSTYGAYLGDDGEGDDLQHPRSWEASERQWRLILSGKY